MNPSDLTPGDEVTVEYENENGETRTCGDQHPGEVQPTWGDDAKVQFGTGRTANVLIIRTDGTVRHKPRFNANGRGENGTLTAVKVVA